MLQTDFRLSKPKRVLICVKSVCSSGVFSESVSVMEGDSVTLNTELTEIHGDEVMWNFGAEKSMIADYNRVFGICFTFNGTDGRFRDRLKLDNQTGSLTITNITTEHAGVYQLQISGVELSSKKYSSKKFSHTISVYGELRPNLLRVHIF